MPLLNNRKMTVYPYIVQVAIGILFYYRLELIRLLSSFYRNIFGRGESALDVPIKSVDSRSVTKVDDYWNDHTVNSLPFSTRWESEEYYNWLTWEYPLLSQFMEFYKDRSGSVVLDYGCGPGNDIYRLLIRNKAKKVIGMDISLKALDLAGKRMSLYAIDPVSLELIQISDSSAELPAEDSSIDYLNCSGVLHHTSTPDEILMEFARVMKKQAYGHIMVYNEDSIFYHLYVAYLVMIIDKKYLTMDIKEAFSKSTDGEHCPISQCYRSRDFIALCEKAGLLAEYKGGYFSQSELRWFRKYFNKAIRDERLAIEHKDFLRSLKLDDEGFPMYIGKHAGIGGVYKISRM